MTIAIFVLISDRLLDYLDLFVHLPQMIYLRKFKNLRTLSLTGNPVCDNEVYSMFIAAYLPNLVYLDFRLVEENNVRISRGAPYYKPIVRPQLPRCPPQGDSACMTWEPSSNLS